MKFDLFRRVIFIVVLLLLLILLIGCAEEKAESDLVIVGEQVNDDVESVSVPDDGLDSALQELEELEGGSS